MPDFEITDPVTGKTLVLTGDSEPTEQELEEVFSQFEAPEPVPVPQPEGIPLTPIEIPEPVTTPAETTQVPIDIQEPEPRLEDLQDIPAVEARPETLGVEEARAALPTQPILPTLPDPKDEESFASAVGQSIKGAAAQTLLNISNLPDAIVDTYFMVNNNFNKLVNLAVPGKIVREDITSKDLGLRKEDPIEAKLRAISEESTKAVNQAVGSEGVVDRLQNGDVGGATKKLITNAVAQVPMLTTVAIGSILKVPPALISAGLGAQSTSEQLDQYWQDVEQGLETQGFDAAVLNSVANGTIEALTERMGTVEVLKPLRGVFGQITKEAGEEVSKKVAGNVFGRLLGKVFSAAKQEVPEEFVAGFSQTVSNKIFGSDPDATFTDAIKAGVEGSLTALATSFGTGGVSGLAEISQAPVQVAQEITPEATPEAIPEVTPTPTQEVTVAEQAEQIAQEAEEAGIPRPAQEATLANLGVFRLEENLSKVVESTPNKNVEAADKATDRILKRRTPPINDQELLDPSQSVVRKAEEIGDPENLENVKDLFELTRDEVYNWPTKRSFTRAAVTALEQGKPLNIVSMDISNQRGLNDFFKGKIKDSSGLEYGEEWVNSLPQELQEGFRNPDGSLKTGNTAADVVLNLMAQRLDQSYTNERGRTYRTGGDELAVNRINEDIETTLGVTDQVISDISDLVTSLKLDKIPHSRQGGIPSGVNIDFGVHEIDPNVDIDTEIQRVNDDMESNKLNRLQRIAEETVDKQGNPLYTYDKELGRFIRVDRIKRKDVRVERAVRGPEVAEDVETRKKPPRKAKAPRPTKAPTEVKQKPKVSQQKVATTKQPDQTPTISRKKSEADLFKKAPTKALLDQETGSVNVGQISQIGKEAKTLTKNFARRFFTSKGDKPTEVFSAELEKQGTTSAIMRDVKFTLADFDRAAKEVFGGTLTPDISDDQLFVINEALNGERSMDDLPDQIRNIAIRMRSHLDAMSQKLIDLGVAEGDLANIITSGKGTWLNRSYQVFDDPKWSKKVDPEIRNKAKSFLRQELEDFIIDLNSKIIELQSKGIKLEQQLRNPDADVNNISSQIQKNNKQIESLIEELKENQPTEENVEGLLERLLYKETGPIDILRREGTLGSKNLSIFKKRKNIAPEIRALWGEFKDPRVNYARSISKMAQIVANHQFLTQVREAGLDKFFFKRPKKIGEQSFVVPITAEGNKALAPLDGLFTTKEIADEFKHMGETQILPWYLRHYMKVVGTTKYAKTIGSLTTHIRNVLANPMFAIINGHWDIRAAGTSMNTIATDLFSLNNQDYRDFIKKMTKLRVIDEGARAGELRDVIKDAMAVDAEAIVNKRIDRVLKSALKGIENLYGAEDDFFKIYGFINEFNRHREALPDMSVEDVEKIAAEKIRNTYPTYSMIPKAVKAIRRFPLIGTFVSFPSEVMRTSYNTIKIMNEELKDPKLRHIGLKRLAGLSIGLAVPVAATVAGRFLAGVGKKDEEDARLFMPPWSENGQILWLSKEKDGTFSYVDLGYVDPHTYIKAPLIAFMRGQDWKKSIRDLGAETFEPFFSEDIFTQKIFDYKRNKTQRGKPVYNPEDDFIKQVQDVSAHFFSALEPGTVTGMRRIWKGFTKEPVNAFGKTYDPRLEGLAMFTGQRISKVDTKESLSFKAREFNKQLQNIATLSKGKKPSDEFKTKRRAYDNFKKYINAARRLGVSDSRISKTLELAQMPKVDRNIVMSKFNPKKEAKELLNKVIKSRIRKEKNKAQRSLLIKQIKED